MQYLLYRNVRKNAENMFFLEFAGFFLVSMVVPNFSGKKLFSWLFSNNQNTTSLEIAAYKPKTNKDHFIA